MSRAARRLRRWLGRARPARADLTRALSTGLVATATTVALFVGAVALLVVAANRPGLRAVAGVLIVIELFAFLRSPIRYAERISGHALGLRAVTQWRRWVVVAVGGWSYDRWRRHASGDLLDRALTDTDELQDLWLRGYLPLVTVIATMAGADVVLALLPPVGAFVVDAAAIALLQAAGVATLLAGLSPLVGVDGAVRRARAHYQATLVELSAAAPELLLLGAGDLVDARVRAPVAALRDAERARRRRRSRYGALPVVVTLLGLGVLALHHPGTSPVWTVVATLLALAGYELLGVARDALDTFVAVSAAAERLEELDGPTPGGSVPWPEEVTLRADAVTVREGERLLAREVTLTVTPRRRVALTGASGTGKSALLRVLAGLDGADGGAVTIGERPLDQLDEAELRRHLAYVASEPGLFTGYVGDVLTMGRALSRDVLDDLGRLGIRVAATTLWDELSRGERQRAAVVRALATQPALAILDEPTSGLGHAETAAVLALIEHAGPGVVVATHDAQVMAWCDEVVELRDGALVSLKR
ncbi:MAG: ATP-binding cassette domain-containing protein [Acidimicrobiales bacterium]